MIQRVLAIPHKRHKRALVAFLEPAELEAILAAPNQETWVGRRDHALLSLTAQPNTKVARYKAPDALLAFLSGG